MCAELAKSAQSGGAEGPGGRRGKGRVRDPSQTQCCVSGPVGSETFSWIWGKSFRIREAPDPKELQSTLPN